MNRPTKIISAEQSVAYQRWQAPPVEMSPEQRRLRQQEEQRVAEERARLQAKMGGNVPQQQPIQEEIEPEDLPSLPTAEEIEAIQQQAYEEGFEQGKQEGFEAGHVESQQQIQEQMQQLDDMARQFAALAQSLAKPFSELDQQVENELLTLVVSMVKQLTRRELHIDPTMIMGTIREAVAALPVADRELSIILHPDDAALVRSSLMQDESHQYAWKVSEDPMMTRGGCRVVSHTSQVDATVESRVQAVIASALGGGRAADMGFK